MKLSDKAYIHKIALRGHAVIDAVLLAAYTMEWLNGSRTFGYYMIIAAFTVLPVAAEYIIYFRDRENTLVRHIMGFSYSSMYIFIIFTTQSQYAFTYCIPMYILITLFSDIPYCIEICVGGFLSNVAYAVYYGMTTGYTPEELPDLTIRIACMALVGIYMIWTAIAMKKVNDQKQRRIQEQQEQSNRMMETILNTSDGMIEDITEVTDKMGLLGDSVHQIRDSMGEVSSGSNETAISIQNQMQRTEQIQAHIAKVKDSSGNIETYINLTTQKVDNGRERMDLLARQSEETARANEQVLTRMQELGEYARQMNTIVETITSIAGNTGMLALNASIEAARAGEAGKGFAVVADQISGLSSQTKSATVHIAGLIGNVTRELQEVSRAIDEAARGNQENRESTQLVAESFADIARGAEQIERESRELMETVNRLEEANADIVEKIQNISAITEEVSAHAHETYDACEANSRLVTQVDQRVHHLDEGAGRLKAIR